jgi:hypothetical protein
MDLVRRLDSNLNDSLSYCFAGAFALNHRHCHIATCNVDLDGLGHFPCGALAPDAYLSRTVSFSGPVEFVDREWPLSGKSNVR